MILQRLRDAEDDVKFGEFSGREGDIVSGVIQQGRDPQDVLVDLGRLEALLPVAERVPGERYEHGTRIKCLVVSVRRGMRGPQVNLSRSHPNLVKKLFALEVPEIADGTVEICAIAREAGHRTKIAVRSTVPGVNAKGPASARWGSGCATSCTSCTARRSTSSTGPTTPPSSSPTRCRRRGSAASRSSTPTARVGPGRRARLPAVAGDRQGGAERPARRPADRLAHRHPLRRGAPVEPPAPRAATTRRSRRAAAEPSGRLGTFDVTGSALPVRRTAPEHGDSSTTMPAASPVRSAPAWGAGSGPPRHELLRVVADDLGDGLEVVPDPRGRAPGRGAHLHPTPECLELALRRRAFARALRVARAGWAARRLEAHVQQLAPSRSVAALNP